MNYLCLSDRFLKSILMVLGILTVCQSAYSQGVVVFGTIINEQDQRVVGAEVKIGQANVKSNAKGVFAVRINTFPVQLNVKHRLYKDYSEVLRAPVIKRDTLFIAVFLEGKETELEEVTVSSEQIFWVHQKKNTHMIDFALIDREMLLVCKENHNYYLRKLDSIGEKIRDIPIKKNPVGLFEDCTGGIHLIYTDSIFELKLMGNSIAMLPGNSYNETMEILSPCIISSEDNFIVKRLGVHNKMIEYVKIDRSSKKPHLLYTSTDQKAIPGLDDYALENEIAVPLSNPNYKRAPQVIILTDREKWDNQQFYHQILKKPLYVPIFELNDSVFVFDHIKDSALVFSVSGEYVRSFQISYHYFENWKSELLINEEKTKMYAKYEIDGLITLRQIDPSTGKVINLDILEKHIHPLRIQIRGNYAYYMYKHYLDNGIHYLYKQPLKE